MANYVKFELEDGTVVFIEATDVPRSAPGFPLGSKGDHPSEQASISFEKSIQSVRKMAAALVQEMRTGFSQQPDEVQMNFGLKASAEIGGLVVARGGAESNYNVMLRWGNKDKDKDKDEKESSQVKEDEKATEAKEK